MRNRWLAVVTLLAALLAGAQARARPPSDSDWHNAYCVAIGTGEFVEWEKGRETVTLTTKLTRGPTTGFVIALPCKAQEVAVEWRDHIPVYAGRLPISVLHETLEHMCGWACLTQVYPLIADVFSPSLGRSAEPAQTRPVEEDGLRCIIISPRNGTELVENLQAARVDLAPGESDRIAKYADGAHCFAVVGIASWTAYRGAVDREEAVITGSDERALSLELVFPTVRPVVPARTVESPDYVPNDNICVLGNWDVSPGRMKSSRVEHFWGQKKARHSAAKGAVAYTRIQPTGSELPGEFWLEAPQEKAIGWIEWWAAFLNRWPVFFAATALWVALVSYVCGGLAGLIAAKRWAGYARLGLWNLATLIGLAIAARRAVHLKELGQSWRRKAYLFTFSVLFLLMNFGTDWLLTAIMGRYWPVGGLVWPWYGIGG